MILFLGSGVSLASGLPSVSDITNELLDGHFYYCSSSAPMFYASLPSGKTAERLDKVQALLRVLRSVDQHFLKEAGPYPSRGTYKKSGSIYRSETTYEDLFSMAQQLRQNGLGLTEDAMIGALVDRVEVEAGDLLGDGCLEARRILLANLSGIATQFIEWSVARVLNQRNGKGLDLVIELAKSPNIERLDIVTLNHDILVESSLTGAGISFEDGFGEEDSGFRLFNDRRYDESHSRVRIFKLHGSIDWFKVNGTSFPVKCSGDNSEDCRGGSREGRVVASATPTFLSGSGKILAYNRGIFSEIFFHFHKALKESRSIIMSGYGWGDTAINFRIMNWMDYSNVNSLMILHRNPDELIDRSMQLAEVYRPYVENRRIVLRHSWLSETHISDISDFIQRDSPSMQ